MAGQRVADAKAQFADLIRRAEAGEEIELTGYGRPVARLTDSTDRVIRLIGCTRGQFTAPHDSNHGDEAAAGLFAAGGMLPE